MHSEYKGLRGFHGCRPRDVESYYRYGIQPANHRELDTQARQIFLTDEFPEVSAETIDNAIVRIGSSDEHRVHAILDDRVLLNRAGHYLIYGSERVCAIAARLGPGELPDYRQALKRYGRPTVFEVAIPWEVPTEGELQHLSEYISRELAFVRRGESVSELDFTVTLYQPISPGQILSHYHPEVVIDPLLGMTE